MSLGDGGLKAELIINNDEIGSSFSYSVIVTVIVIVIVMLRVIDVENSTPTIRVRLKTVATREALQSSLHQCCDK